MHHEQAQSNRGRHGRKKDFPDAERLVKQLVADELIPTLFTIALDLTKMQVYAFLDCGSHIPKPL
jgi:hypothetical protein